jgi:energy-coupling factor transport system ATP-binding protein
MAGLDPAGRRAILDMLSGIRRETGCAVIMVSHSMDDIAAYSDRVAVMQDGSIIRTGTPAEIFGGELDLEAMGLDLPAASYLGNLLRSRGMDVPEIYTIDGMAEYLLGRRQGA